MGTITCSTVLKRNTMSLSFIQERMCCISHVQLETSKGGLQGQAASQASASVIGDVLFGLQTQKWVKATSLAANEQDPKPDGLDSGNTSWLS